MLHTFAQKVRQIGKIECLIEQLCLQYILCLGVSAEMNQTVGPLNHMALISNNAIAFSYSPSPLKINA